MNNISEELKAEIENFDYEALFAGCGDIPHTKESLKLEAEIEAEKKEEAIEAAKYRKCGKCNGKGRIGHYHYVSNGVCFACDGEGKIYKA
jgi:DnaJ-class molecular chaperone